jgi:hypothetical protein
MLALASKEKAIEPLVLADGGKAIEAAGEKLVNVALMAYIEDKLVFGSFENTVQSDRQFHHAEVGTKVTAGIGENPDELVADFLCELREIFAGDFFEVGG